MATEALVSTLVEKLAAGAIDQVGRALGVRSELENLRSELSAVRAAIHAAEECSATQADVRDWVAKLKDAAYDVDDLLDEFQSTDPQLWRQQDTAISNKVRVFFSRSNPLAFRFKMSSKIKAMVDKLDMIAKERSRYNFQPRVDPPSYALQHQTDTRTTFAVIDETSIYGRDDDVQKILKLLFEKETDHKEEHLSVVTIVGMGGLGKTTLAQLVFKHDRVVKQERFDKRIWVYVSDKFVIKRIATAIIESVTGDKCDLSELDPIINRVQQILAGKKFLLILDDVWNENQEEWDKVKGFLAVGAKGSKIVVTTRSGNIASMMGTTSPYRLGVLSDDASWRLFEKRAFRSEDIQRDPSLEEIGREILAKCGGSPLAAKTLGSLMRSKTGREEWRAVRDSDIWRSTGEGNQVMAFLKLSYNHLSPNLKQCFAYCCIFPKGTSIKMDELVLHWIAMGFIPCNASLESAINKGKEIVKSLVWISFLDHEGLSGRFYKMHDLVHDLAKSVSGDEHFICYTDQKATIPQRCCLCTLVGISKESKLKDLFRESRKIRALRIENSNVNTSILFTSLPLLRVLDMGCSPIEEVHSSISRLKHLRYFGVGENWHISQLPNSIGGLHNLLALDASRCHQLSSVSESIGKLANLRTLDISYCRSLNSLPQSLGNLSNLENLDLEWCRGIAELPETIGKLANLRTLLLVNCKTLHSLPQSLGNLSKLEELDLWNCKGITELPETIGKLANLRTLRLSSCKALNSLPQSLGNLSKLEELHLCNCKGITELPESIGELANLRTLDISYCEALQTLPQSLSDLSNLEALDLQGCPEIVELPEGMGNMTNLRHLRNEWMSSLRGMPLGIGKMRSLLTLQLFVVGEGINHSSIVEMQHLNLIEEELELRHLENVKSPGDAVGANMKEKHKLQRLCLRWSDSISYDPDSLIHEEVLADLIPHRNLEILEIVMYPGINFSNWVRMMRDSVPNLVQLILYRLKSLPPFPRGLPPCLKRLEIGGIDTQTNLELSGGGSFPLLQLKKLCLSDMPNLEEWFTVMASVELYPRLVKLKIDKCPKMHAEPCIPASVKQLSLHSSDELLISTGRVVEGADMQGVSCGGALEVLKIFVSNEMVDLPEAIRRFTSLWTLYIRDCPNLARLPEWLRELTSLKKLTIYDCHSSLKERCKEDTGEDWPIIAHIQQVYIG